jgi:hypothetical protein
MRKILLAAIVVAAALAMPGRASAWGGCGFRGGWGGWGYGFRSSGWAYPPGSVYFAPGYYPPPVYPYPYPGSYYYPYPYSYSYFRPNGPYGWNGDRNWRDTWQDDGRKTHGYTFH